MIGLKHSLYGATRHIYIFFNDAGKGTEEKQTERIPAWDPLYKARTGFVSKGLGKGGTVSCFANIRCPTI